MLKRTCLRLLSETIEAFGKMAFVSGPRQVGKTTLAEEYRKQYSQGFYLNWDNLSHRKLLLKDPYFFERENRDPELPFLLVFDEIHKYARWKNYLKGVYDTYRDEFRVLVTGSGRLDLFKKRGESLLGRYFNIPLFPLSVGELSGVWNSWTQFASASKEPPEESKESRGHYETLLACSGFPEPYLRNSRSFYNRWFEERKTLLLREDIRDFSAIREISLLEHLSHLIPERTGGLLSLNSLKEDVGVAFETIRDWLVLLERFYYLFRVSPYAGSRSRTLRKETKAYLYDWVEVDDEGSRFENLIAVHLFKAVRTWQAMGEGEMDLRFIRDKEKREVDFVVLRKRMPVCLVECKLSDTSLSPSLLYYQKHFSVPLAIQVVHTSGVCKKLRMERNTQWIISADRWLRALP